MVKIDSTGNEQLENALAEYAIEKIKHSLKNKEPIFLAYGHQTMLGGNTIEILATVGVGLDDLFTDVQKMIGVEAANKLFDSFIKSLIEEIRKN